MEIAIWIIAICELLRTVQCAIQLHMIHHDSDAKDNAYAEFVKSLKRDDREMVEELLKEFEKQEKNKEENSIG